jgi:circadian clock protein KaiB
MKLDVPVRPAGQGARRTARRRMAISEPPDMARVKPQRAALVLRLYVAGHAPNSVRAIANARAICDDHFASGHEIEIVDVLEHPQRAVADGIIVTPTLLKLSPLPVRRMIGNLSNTRQVLLTLAKT